jgi:CHAT domain-containing protein
LDQRITTLGNLARLRMMTDTSLGLPALHPARNDLREATTCVEGFCAIQTEEGHRQQIRRDTIGVFDQLVQVNVALWKIEGDANALREAVKAAEAGRARSLLDRLAHEILNPAYTPAALAQEFRRIHQELQEARRRLHEEQTLPPVPADPSPPPDDTDDNSPSQRTRSGGPRSPALLLRLGQQGQARERIDECRREIERLRTRYREKLEEIQAFDKEFDPERPVVPIDADTATNLLPTDGLTALVQFTLTAEQGVALVLTRDDVSLVQLPNFPGDRAWEQAQRWYDAYYACRGTADYEQQWSAVLRGVLAEVGRDVVQPIFAVLAKLGIKRWIMAPHRALHLFPLHACPLDASRLLADEVEVVYTPSLSMLHRCATRRRQPPQTALVAADPTSDLAFARVEGYAAAGLAPVATPLIGGRVTRTVLLKAAPDCHVFHYAGHALFNPVDPLTSALVLLDGDNPDHWLTVRDIFCGLHLRDCTLAIIDGCETSMHRPEPTDELIGLTAGFLYAGAASVVSTLWAINDLSSALLMHKFRQLWAKGKPVAAALAEAQRWLRWDIQTGPQLQREMLPELLAAIRVPELAAKCKEQAAYYAQRNPASRPFESPFHWAAFTANGWAHTTTKAS